MGGVTVHARYFSVLAVEGVEKYDVEITECVKLKVSAPFNY